MISTVMTSSSACSAPNPYPNFLPSSASFTYINLSSPSDYHRHVLASYRNFLASSSYSLAYSIPEKLRQLAAKVGAIIDSIPSSSSEKLLKLAAGVRAIVAIVDSIPSSIGFSYFEKRILRQLAAAVGAIIDSMKFAQLRPAVSTSSPSLPLTRQRSRQTVPTTTVLPMPRRYSLANPPSQPSTTPKSISVPEPILAMTDAAHVVPCAEIIMPSHVFPETSSFLDTGHALTGKQKCPGLAITSLSEYANMCHTYEHIGMKNNETRKEFLNLEHIGMKNNVDRKEVLNLEARMFPCPLNLEHCSSECKTETARDSAALIKSNLNSVDANKGAVVFGSSFYSRSPPSLVVVKDQTSSGSKSRDQGGGAGNQGNGGVAANGGGQGNEEVQQLANKEILPDGIKIIFVDRIVGELIIMILAREDQVDWPTFCMNVRRVRCDDAEGPPPGEDPGYNLWPDCEVRMTVRLRDRCYYDFTPLRLSALLNSNRMNWAYLKMAISAVRLIHHVGEAYVCGTQSG